MSELIESSVAGIKDLAGQIAKREQPAKPSYPDPFAGLSTGSSGTSADPLSQATRNVKNADDAIASMNAQLAKNHEDLEKELAELNKNLATDKYFGMSEKTKTDLADAAAEEKKKEEALLEGEDALDGFSGLTDVLEEKVVGQKEFIKKLVISFKRPYVMPPEGSKALNAILLTGHDDTGKHFALTELAGELGLKVIRKRPRQR
jgi:ATP-dependent Clp protease ATP-binding subunit ClpA